MSDSTLAASEALERWSRCKVVGRQIKRVANQTRESFAECFRRIRCSHRAEVQVQRSVEYTENGAAFEHIDGHFGLKEAVVVPRPHPTSAPNSLHAS